MQYLVGKPWQLSPKNINQSNKNNRNKKSCFHLLFLCCNKLLVKCILDKVNSFYTRPCSDWLNNIWTRMQTVFRLPVGWRSLSFNLSWRIVFRLNILTLLLTLCGLASRDTTRRPRAQRTSP